MRLMTFNIWKGGRDAEGGDRTAPIVEVIEAAAPDILALQECNRFDADGGALLHHYERSLGMDGALALAHGTGYHVALFTRGCEVHATAALHDGLHHAALQLELTCDGRRLSVLCAHLSPFEADRRRDEAQLLAGRLPGERGAVLMGDLNALSRRDLGRYDPSSWPERYRDRHAGPAGELDTGAIDTLEAAGLVDLAAQAGAADDTRPTPLLPGRPAQRLDYVFATAALAARVTGATVVRDARAQRASDHLPVVVDLEG